VVASGQPNRVEVPTQRTGDRQRSAHRSTSTSTYYTGPGAQHLALATNDILTTVDILRAKGSSSLATPDSYYSTQHCARESHVRVHRGAANAEASWSTDEDGLPAADSSPSPSATDPRCSSSLSSATARLDSASATSSPLRGHRAGAGQTRQLLAARTSRPSERPLIIGVHHICALRERSAWCARSRVGIRKPTSSQSSTDRGDPFGAPGETGWSGPAIRELMRRLA